MSTLGPWLTLGLLISCELYLPAGAVTPSGLYSTQRAILTFSIGKHTHLCIEIHTILL